MRCSLVLVLVMPLALALTAALAAAPAEAKFRSLHRQQGRGHADVAFDFVMPEGGPDVLRTELYGELSTGALGGYLSIPIVRSLDDDLDVSEVGNVELGLLAEGGQPELSIVGHMGVAIETIDARGLDELTVLALGALPRLEDLLASAPQVTTIRLGASPRARGGPFFGQLDLGVDFHLVDGDGGGGEDLQSYHVGVGVGLDLDVLELTGEFVHADLIGEDSRLPGMDLDLQTVGATATLELSILEPFVAYHTLLDDTDVHIVSFGLTLDFD